jgi:F420-0:gamma-glutamyl ligase
MGNMGLCPPVGQGNMFTNMGIDRSNMPNQVKKMPNPSNFKIVKCKNFEAGIYLFFLHYFF